VVLATFYGQRHEPRYDNNYVNFLTTIHKVNGRENYVVSKRKRPSDTSKPCKNARKQFGAERELKIESVPFPLSRSSNHHSLSRSPVNSASHDPTMPRPNKKAKQLEESRAKALQKRKLKLLQYVFSRSLKCMLVADKR
jgi:hypothetical protein